MFGHLHVYTFVWIIAQRTIQVKQQGLGWEPSMEYMTGAAHLRWTIARVRWVIESEFPTDRQSPAVTVPS